MELSSKKASKLPAVRAREGRRKERRLPNEPTLPMLDRNMSKMLLERTNANKKVQGKSMYKVVIKLLHSSKKKNHPSQTKLPSHLFTEMGNKGFEVFNTQKTSK